MSAAEELKAKGNKAFQAKEYLDAVKYYKEGTEKDPQNHVLWSNLAAAYISLNRFKDAIAACDESIRADPKWMKGYYRQAQAYAELKLFDKAIQTLEAGLKKLPKDEELTKKLKETKEEQAKYNKTRLKDEKGKPYHPALEAKLLGNDAFKKSLYEKAAEFYSRGIQSVENNDVELKCFLLNNRAACYKQLHNHKGIIEDATEVLKTEGKDQKSHIKALVNRGLAYEYMEKWKDALADVSAARELDPSNKQAVDAVTRIKKVLHTYT
eukprot:TRINITY_DN147_c0_g1_i1.p1 TRINITY_DN147_c0_g1~~TRINITY_DN147_c0_g1_i1.p1  ORF type:complete len:267 (-),score=67.88 TRINITY_DN147_c0_g1_i1:82-882(-)